MSPLGEVYLLEWKNPCGLLHNGMCNKWVPAHLPVYLVREPGGGLSSQSSLDLFPLFIHQTYLFYVLSAMLGIGYTE